MAFIDDLAARRNEPLRLYQRELQREALLTPEAEVALGQSMERSVEKALDALAAWPEGIAATLEAARLVANGTASLHAMSTGTQFKPQDTQSVLTADIDGNARGDVAMEPPAAEGDLTGSADELDSPFDLNTKESTGDLSEFCVNAELLSSLPIGPREDASKWKACRCALASLVLISTRK